MDQLDPGGIGCNLFRLFLPNFSKINKKLYQIVNCSTSGLFYMILESNWLTDHKFPNSLQGWVMPPKKIWDDIPPPPIVFFLNQADRPSPSNPNCFAVTPRPQTILNRTALMSFDSPLGLHTRGVVQVCPPPGPRQLPVQLGRAVYFF